jgi:superfamily II DNA or RNA helicase
MALHLLEHQLPVIAAMQKHFRSRETVKWGERNIHPPVVCNASVSSGKSIMIAALALAVRKAAINSPKPRSVFVLVIQRQGELCSQNSEAAWAFNDESKLLNNSLFSASCGKVKSTHFQVVYATEGTLSRALGFGVKAKDGEEPEAPKPQYRFSPYTAEELAKTPEQRALMKKFHPDLIMWDEGHQIPYDNPDSMAVKILSHFYDCKPAMRLACFSGSCFRGTESIVGDTPQHLWRKFASIKPDDPDYPEGGVGDGVISTEFMIEQGWVVPPTFGYPDDADKQYDFSHLNPNGWEYDEAEMDAVVSDHQKLLAVCSDVIEKSANRKGVLIFAATQRHARQIAAAMKDLGVDPDTIGVITEKTKDKDRRRILDQAKTGVIKYTINVAVLTTGVNVPWWDTLVFMRPIGSLVLLIQAIGRVLRLLILDGEVPMFERSNLFGMTAEDRLELIAASSKPDALVMDYADVMNTLGHLYDNQILEQAELEKAKKEKKDLIECPKCMADLGIQTMNSPSARRCIYRNDSGERCEHFWHFRLCPGCMTQNDQVARECRSCRRMLIDPNAVLNNKSYSDGESIPVRSMKAGHGSGGKLWFRYELSTGDTPMEIFYPHAGENKKVNNIIWGKFVDALPIDQRSRLRLKAMKAETVMENIDLIPVPAELSARKKGSRWTIGRRRYAEMEVTL